MAEQENIGTDCAICLSPIRPGKQVSLPCGHNCFDIYCILGFMGDRNIICPLCRMICETFEYTRRGKIREYIIDTPPRPDRPPGC